MMTFRGRPRQAALTPAISWARSFQFRSFTQPRLMTMSISRAPFSTASLVSKILAAIVLYPLGKPMTVQIFKFPWTYSAARLT